MCTCSVGSAQCSGCVVYGPGAMAAIWVLLLLLFLGGYCWSYKWLDLCYGQEDRQQLEEEEAVLEAVNVVDHDIDECVQTLKKIYCQKLERLTKFGGT